MPRIRTVKPDHWNDEDIGTLTRDARLLEIAIRNFADDEGILRWTPAYIKASVFPYDDDLSIDDIATLMAELETHHYVHPYRAGPTRQHLGWMVNFRNDQRINRPQPSKLTPPDLTDNQVRDRYADRDGHTCRVCHQPAGDPTQLTVTHLTPRADGGTDHPSNIAIAHAACLTHLDDTPTQPATHSLPATPSPSGGDSRSDSMNDSLNQSMRDALSRSLNDSVNESLNGAVNPVSRSLLEGKGKRRGEGRERDACARAAPPRCVRHAHLPAEDPGPPCVGCRSVRQRVERERAKAERVAIDEGRLTRIRDQLAARNAPRPAPGPGRALARAVVAELRAAR
ncbi:HNH endonuclease [Pseudonocardia acaciae]|uniref:HNH endonuclease n=1 Tax=Pseudonocardia acaciae TaxID=551276 RepID=UPI00048B8771|nr:HNH endonuclease signature motif containing protein [Pseudonocardia acaciae]